MDDAAGLVGQRVDGKYRLDAILGRGAMGVVYRGVHEALDRPVAVKVLRNLRARDGILVKRFQREARAAAKLSHPHSVQVLDFGEDRDHGFLYLVMELVEGPSLMDVVRAERRLGVRRTAELMAQVASAIGAAHALDIIHRDVKPANMILATRVSEGQGREELVKVCDFGLAKITTEHVDPNSTHDPKLKAAGTPVYMAPEQAVGEPLDPRADIYACGVVLYHLLVGRPPFLSRRSFEILMAHVSKKPVPPRQLVPEIPEAMERLVLWCLVKDRAGRCPDAKTLREGLEQIAVDLGSSGFRARSPSFATLPAVSVVPTAGGSGWTSLSDDLKLEASPPAVPPTARPGVDPVVPAGAALTEGPDGAEHAAPALPLDAIVGLDDGADGPVPGTAVDPLDDIDALVAEAVAEVEEAKGLHRQHAQSDLMAGLEHGRHSDAVAERAAYMYTRYGITYEPYVGDDPFWVRDHRGEALGPLGRDDLFRVLSSCGKLGVASQVLVSADDERWMPATAFVRLVGLELLLEGSTNAETSAESGTIWGGRLEVTSLVAVFARIVRERHTGVLGLQHGPTDEPDRAEVHVINGQPTFVYVNREGMQIPDLLVSQGLIDPKLLGSFLRRALLEERSLESVISRDAGIDMAQWDQRFMQERLREAVRWPAGRFVFDGSRVPGRLRPFSATLLSAVREPIYRESSLRQLETWAYPFLHAPLTPSQWFAEGVRHLRLADAQAQMVRRMLRKRTLGEALEGEGNRRQMALALAYVLYEADILLKPLAA